ncbi:hypothetical protein [Micromonospora sp. S4605]|uniref:hypothetical protein n=1 Tax=Micromonospora sp. S4605 TaxID=1420897 RepID=UPI0011B47666|nr:hypothetical protein [Micromonospora sp. S4605]
MDARICAAGHVVDNGLESAEAKPAGHGSGWHIDRAERAHSNADLGGCGVELVEQPRRRG